MSRVGHLLNTSLEVWRATRVDDGGGGWDTTWSLRSTQRARISQPTARERQAANQSGAELTHTVYLRPGADVLRADELRAGGRVFEVVAVFEPSVPGTYLRADCTVHQPTEGA